MVKKVDIKNLTIVINLVNTSAAAYLNFMEDSKKIKEVDTGKIISSSKIENQFLIIYVDSKPTESYLTKLLIDSLSNNKIDFIAIDELFPDDNSFLLHRKDIPTTKKWVTSKLFNAKTSRLNVKV